MSAGSLLAAPWQVVLVWMGDEFYLNLYLSWCNWCSLPLYERANEVPSLTCNLIWWKVGFLNFEKSVTLVPWKLGAGWPWPLWHSVGRSVDLVRIHQLGGAHHHNWFIELGGMSPLLTSHNKLSMFHGDTMCSIHMKFITSNKFNGSDFVKSRQRGQIWLMAGCVGQFERWGGERPPHIHQHIFIYAAALKLVHPQNSSIFAI